MMKIPMCRCPLCGAALDAATALNKHESMPSPGDFTLCVHCGVSLRFGGTREKLTLSFLDTAAARDLVRNADPKSLLLGSFLTSASRRVEKQIEQFGPLRSGDVEVVRRHG